MNLRLTNLRNGLTREFENPDLHILLLGLAGGGMTEQQTKDALVALTMLEKTGQAQIGNVKLEIIKE